MSLTPHHSVGRRQHPRRGLTPVAAALAALALAAMPALAQSSTQRRDTAAASARADRDTQPATTDRSEVERRMRRWVLPGDEHQHLQRLAGTWRTTITFPGAPGRAPTILTGTSQARSTLGGRFLVLESAVSSGTNALESMTILGFDGRSDRYTYVGYDTFGTYYVTAAGPYDASGRQLVLAGEDRESATRVKHFEVVLRFVSDDEFTHEIVFHGPAGTRFTALEGRHVRVAGADPVK